MVTYPPPANKTLVKYGLTIQQWWQLFGDGHCPACTKAYRWLDLNRRACVDHDHATGEIRGMLCAACNYEWGCLRENVEWLERMLAYATQTPASKLWDPVPRVKGAPPRKEES